jgi:hypothetical protein
LTSDPNYNYDLVIPLSGSIGPITCDDQALACYVATPQNVSFPSP